MLAQQINCCNRDAVCPAPLQRALRELRRPVRAGAALLPLVGEGSGEDRARGRGASAAVAEGRRLGGGGRGGRAGRGRRAALALRQARREVEHVHRAFAGRRYNSGGADAEPFARARPALVGARAGSEGRPCHPSPARLTHNHEWLPTARSSWRQPKLLRDLNCVSPTSESSLRFRLSSWHRLLRLRQSNRLSSRSRL